MTSSQNEAVILTDLSSSSERGRKREREKERKREREKERKKERKKERERKKKREKLRYSGAALFGAVTH